MANYSSYCTRAVYMNDVYSNSHASFTHGMLKVVQVVWENNYTSIFMYPVYIYQCIPKIPTTKVQGKV